MKTFVLAMFLILTATKAIRAGELRVLSDVLLPATAVPYRTAAKMETNRFTLIRRQLEVSDDRSNTTPQRVARYIISGPKGKQVVVNSPWPPAGDFTICQDNHGTSGVRWGDRGHILMRDLDLDRREPQEDILSLGVDRMYEIRTKLYADQVITGLPNTVTLDGRRAERMELTFFGLERGADGTFGLKAETPLHKRQVTVSGKDKQWTVTVDNTTVETAPPGTSSTP